MEPKKKYSVHLPKTAFPMKADLPAREPQWLAAWERADLYAKVLEKKGPKGPFVLHDGPPYANGPIHMGHALNKILKDFVVKFKNLSGFRSPYIPGWDCHGLPIEHQLMKEKGWDKRKVGRLAFRREAAKYAEHWIEIQRKEFKRLGILGDWEHPYKTLAPEYEAGIARVFYDLALKGCVVQDKKPVYWCPSCETALAEAEVEYQDKKSPSTFVKFPVQEWPAGAAALKTPGKKASVLVWTTTPWTLPANVALAFNPEGRYRVWESAGAPDRYLVGDPGWAMLEKMFGGGRETAAVTGLELEGLIAKNPLNNNDSQGILGEFVSVEEGTGVVHIAPGHGEDDYVAGKAYGLAVLSPVDDRGRFTGEVLPNDLVGKSIWEANPLILEKLAKAQLLLKTEEVTHSYPHCWRCKNPIIFRAALQWFLKITDEFRKALLASADRVAWIPDYGKDRLVSMLKTRPDWCLSRQRFWGTPIPMFFCEKCAEPLRDEKVFANVVAAFKEKGSDVWYEKAPADFGATAPCAKCGHAGFRKEEDILDVWFDSGVSWVSVLQAREATKGVARQDVLYLEGSDQHRGWFQTSLLPAVALTGEPPYGQVLTHGFVLDGQGRAMSKSLGNVIAPQTMLEKYGADVIRLWVAVTDYREDVRLSQDIIDRVVDSYRKIRNTLRYLLGNLGDFVPAKHAVALKDMTPLDLAALGAWNKTREQVQKHYERYEFHLVTAALADHFCINVLSEYYLDVLKDTLYCDPADAPRRRSAQTALWHLARGLAGALAPVLSFTAEEVWGTLRDQGLLAPGDVGESVFLNPFPSEIPLPVHYVMAEFLAARRAANEALEKARQAGKVKAANDAKLALTVYPGQSPFAQFSDSELAAVLGVASVAVSPAGRPEPLDVRSIEPAPGQKCARCWLWRELGPEGLCARCAEAERLAVR